MAAHPTKTPVGDVFPVGPTGGMTGLSGHGACPLDGVPPAFPTSEAEWADRLGPGLAGFAACGLGSEPESVGAARRFAGATLRNWGLTALVDSVAIVVSEMVSNAMRYGLTAPLQCGSAASPAWLGLLRQETGVLCAVSDPGTDVPVVKVPDHFAESGRGLHIIASLSEAWGWSSPDGAGKTVWATISTQDSR